MRERDIEWARDKGGRERDRERETGWQTLTLKQHSINHKRTSKARKIRYF